MQPRPSIDPSHFPFPELDTSHPGAGDRAYVERRRHLYDVARSSRISGRGIPALDHTEDEDRVWRHVYARLGEAHARHACRLYLAGKRRLGFDPDRMPSLRAIDAASRAWGGLGLVVAEGLVPAREFFAHLARGEMPCTQYLRHASRPEYTPEPDAVHDVLGHVPFLVDPAYAAVVQAIGRAGSAASEDQLPALSRLYWFTIEFGLIEEEAELRIFGAGLLSSFGEMRHALSDDVERLPFDLDAVLETDYDPTRMQPRLFVLSSFGALERAVARLGGWPR